VSKIPDDIEITWGMVAVAMIAIEMLWWFIIGIVVMRWLRKKGGISK